MTSKVVESKQYPCLLNSHLWKPLIIKGGLGRDAATVGARYHSFIHYNDTHHPIGYISQMSPSGEVQSSQVWHRRYQVTGLPFNRNALHMVAHTMVAGTLDSRATDAIDTHDIMAPGCLQLLRLREKEKSE